jgi:hypothetical protein
MCSFLCGVILPRITPDLTRVILSLITILICALFFYFRFYQKRQLERRIQRAKLELEAHYRPLGNQVHICGIQHFILHTGLHVQLSVYRTPSQVLNSVQTDQICGSNVTCFKYHVLSM